MIRKLLATTAISLIATTGAWSAQTKPQVMAPEMTQEGYLQNMGQAELASDMIGETIYASTAPDAEAIGDVNDLVVSEDGTIQAVVIGVGGFLGVGEKNVAVGFDKIRWSEDQDGNKVAVFEASKQSLEKAPEFVPPEDRAADHAMAPAAGTSTAMAPATDSTAMAPATDATKKPSDMSSTEQPAAGSTDTAMAPAAADQSAMAGLTDVDAGSLSAEQLLGATVYSSDDQDIGDVGDVRLAADGGKVDAMIVDVGGFLGMGEKPVAIGFDNLTVRRDDGDTYYVYTDFTREELESAPTYDKATYDDQRDTMRLTMRASQ